MPKTLEIGYKKETILEKPKTLMHKGKRTATSVAVRLFLNTFSKADLRLKQSEIKVVKQPTKMTK